jgi:hypothetical protein
MTFLAHLPLLRIADEEVPFGEGSLWRLPFDAYNSFSAEAFTDHRQSYDETAPVFYRLDADVESPFLRPATSHTNRVAELKVPSNNWGSISALGLDFILKFHENLVERARAALLLAAPGCSVPESLLSVTFVRLTEPEVFQVGQLSADLIRVQGDADQEYLFLPTTAGQPLPTEVVQDAERCLTTVDTLMTEPELLAALRALLGSTAPILSPTDQLVLSVRALEALLLPDITNGMKRTFAARGSRLLAVDDPHLKRLHDVARTLYDVRSAAVHSQGTRPSDAALLTAHQAHAEQLLAAAIRRLASQSHAFPVAEQRRALDSAPPDFARNRYAVPIAAPAGLRSPERLLRLHSRIVATASSGVDMGYTDGTVSWSPLVGLALAQPAEGFALKKGPPVGLAIQPLSGQEMVALEERDIGRDFISPLRFESEPSAAVLSTGMLGHAFEPSPTNLLPFLRLRDLGTTALRLAGFSEFYDPELLGVFVYQGPVRTRYPSVFRQTIERNMQSPPKRWIAEPDIARVSEFVRLLTDYDSRARHDQIDLVLRLFRHAFNREFLPQISRAGLLLSAVEAMLGRFRAPKQLEGLAAGLIKAECPIAAEWFEERGRAFRNSIAHGSWPDADIDPLPMDHLTQVVGALIPKYVELWLALSDRTSTSPLRAFLKHAASHTP